MRNHLDQLRRQQVLSAQPIRLTEKSLQKERPAAFLILDLPGPAVGSCTTQHPPVVNLKEVILNHLFL